VACRAPIEPRDIDPIVDYLIGIGSSNWARAWMVRTTIQGYFCDPQNPWQRRSDENTNGLVGQYFPSGTDLSVYSQTHLSRVARQLNERPRKTLAFEIPAVRFNGCVAPTGGTGSQSGHSMNWRSRLIFQWNRRSGFLVCGKIGRIRWIERRTA
jgi:hypothetical protein